MPLKTYLERLQLIDSLIRRKATGNQHTLSKKVRLSRSALNKLLNEMKELGFPIKYSHIKQTYYYESNGKMVKSLFIQEQPDLEINNNRS